MGSPTAWPHRVRWEPLAWVAASDAAANAVGRMAEPLAHWAPPVGTGILGLAAVGTVLLWTTAIQRWVNIGEPSAPPVRMTWPARVSWAVWAFAWGAIVLLIIGTGYALRHVVAPAMLRLGMIAAGLGAFSALGMVGTVAIIRRHPPFDRWSPCQPGRWLGYWAILTAVDAGVLALGWWAVHQAWWVQELGGGIVLAWSLGELSILARWAKRPSVHPGR